MHPRVTLATVAVDRLSEIFVRNGIPLELCTDGGPQFTVKEFREFASQYDFVHTVLSTRFSRTNGLAGGVQMVNCILCKTECAKEDFWLGLLDSQAAPLEDGRSLAKLPMGRGLRTLLPEFTALPTSPVRKHVQNEIKGTHLAPLQTGAMVCIRDNERWGHKARVQYSVTPR